MLSCCHVGGSAHYLRGHFASEVDAAHVQVVGVGMRIAGEYLADIEAAKPTANAFHFLHAANLQTCGGEGFAHFFYAQREVYIFLKPFV